MLRLDGVYTWEHGRPHFQRAAAPNDAARPPPRANGALCQGRKEALDGEWAGLNEPNGAAWMLRRSER